MDDWGDPWADDSKPPTPLIVAPTTSTATSNTLPTWDDGAEWNTAEGDDADWGEFEDPWTLQEGQETKGVSKHVAQEPEEESASSSESGSRSGRSPKSEPDGQARPEERNASLITSVSPTKEDIEVDPGNASSSDQCDTDSDHSTTNGHAIAPSSVVPSKASGIVKIPVRESEHDREDSTRPSSSQTKDSESTSPLGTSRTSLEVDPRPAAVTTEDLLPDTLSGAKEQNAEEKGLEGDDGIGPKSAASNGTESPEELLQETEESSPEEQPASDLHNAKPHIPGPSFDIDQLIVEDLLKGLTDGDPGSNLLSSDPLESVSAKKAWYRITRHETMREFNTGKDDDNYVRVSWLNSAVRQEANKTVTRWAIEDRSTGRPTLGRPGAAFGWDESPAGHNRSLPASTTTTPLPPAVNVTPKDFEKTAAAPVVQFGWSSPADDNVARVSRDSPRPREDETVLPKVSFAPQIPSKARPMSTDFSPQSSQFKHKKGSKSVSAPEVFILRPGIDAIMHSAAQKDLSISPMVPSVAAADSATMPEMSQSASGDVLPDPFQPIRIEPPGSALGFPDGDEEFVWGDTVQATALPEQQGIAASSPDEWPSPVLGQDADKNPLPVIPSPPSSLLQHQSPDMLDPWASTDLSVFESAPPPPPPKPFPTQPHVRQPSISHPPSQTPPLPTSPGISSKTTLPPLPSQPAAQQHQTTVHTILAELPNLDYMLR